MKIVSFNLSNSLGSVFSPIFLISPVIIFMIILFSMENNIKKIKVFISILIYIICMIFFGILMQSNYNTFYLSVYYTNETNSEINIKKSDIINDILNNNIKEKSNSQIYKQTFTITKEEYEKLYDFKNKIKKDNEFGKVNIID